MLRRFIGLGLVLACALPASLALAQMPSGSRLDDVVKSGKLRVCTPGDYKPFSYQDQRGQAVRRDRRYIQRVKVP